MGTVTTRGTSHKNDFCAVAEPFLQTEGLPFAEVLERRLGAVQQGFQFILGQLDDLRVRRRHEIHFCLTGRPPPVTRRP